MPVSDILANGRDRLTNQQIADFMLQAERDARDARRRGDFVKAAQCIRERDLLASAIN